MSPGFPQQNHFFCNCPSSKSLPPRHPGGWERVGLHQKHSPCPTRGFRVLSEKQAPPKNPCQVHNRELAGWGCPLVTQQFLGWKMLNQKWGAHKSVNLLMLHPQKRKKADWLHPLTTHAGCRGHVALTWQPFPPPAAPPHRGLGYSSATPWLLSPPCSAASLPQRPREAFGEGERAVWIGGKPQPP